MHIVSATIKSLKPDYTDHAKIYFLFNLLHFYNAVF